MKFEGTSPFLPSRSSPSTYPSYKIMRKYLIRQVNLQRLKFWLKLHHGSLLGICPRANLSLTWILLKTLTKRGHPVLGQLGKLSWNQFYPKSGSPKSDLWCIRGRKHLKLNNLYILCSQWVRSKLPYFIWKLCMCSLFWCIVALCVWRGYRVTDINVFVRPQRCSKYNHKMPISWTIVLIFNKQVAPVSLFQMRYDRLPNHEKHPSDSQRS